MKRRFVTALGLAVSGFLVFVLPIIATAVTMAVTMIETSGNSYTNAPFLLTMDNTQFTSTGLDIQLKDNNTVLPAMIAEDRTAYVANLSADTTKQLYYSNGNTPATSMPIIVGKGGYLITPDDPALEPGNDFSIEWKGYFASSGRTSDDYVDYVIKANNALDFYTDHTGGTDNIEFDIYNGTEWNSLYINNISVGEHIFKYVYDGSNTYAYLDGQLKDSDSFSGFIPDNGGDWYFNQPYDTYSAPMPYIDYIKISTATQHLAEFSPTTDGVVGIDRSSASGYWADLTGHAGSVAPPETQEVSVTSATNAIAMQNYSTEDYWRELRRGFMAFDTSSLPNNATLTKAALGLFIDYKYDYLNVTPSFNVYGANPASELTLTIADYPQVLSTPLADRISSYSINNTPHAIDYGGIVLSRNWWNFDQDGLDYISLTGYTNLSLRFNYDVSGTPTWPGATNVQSWFTWESQDSTSSEWRPILYTRYSLPNDRTEVLDYQPNDIIQGNVLPDRDTTNGSQDGTIVWGTNPDGVTISLSSFDSGYLATLNDYSTTAGGQILNGNPSLPSQMYTELNPDLPWMPVMSAIFGISQTPEALWWFPFVFGVIAIISLMVYELTTSPDRQTGQGTVDGSLLLQCIVIEVLLVIMALVGSATGHGGMTPFWPVFIFPIAGAAFVMSKKHYSWG